MKKDLMIVDNIRLELRKEYFVKYKHCESNWNKVKITRITDNGHPWQSGKSISGIITDGDYYVQELSDEIEIQQYAMEWLISNASTISHLTMSEILAKFYNSYKPNRINLRK